MQEETPPSELFGYFKELLVEYPRHSKSRHCVGDLSCSLADFGFIIQRNYLKTSHAKGEQDAAGSHVKQKVSQAVLTRLATINSAKAMHKFLTEKFTQPAASSFTASSNSVQLKRRVSFYVPGKGEGAVIRNRPGRKFKEVKGIRKLHSIKSGSEQVVQQFGVKIVPFMIKEWNLAHMQLISFEKNLDIGSSQISHVTNMAAFF